MKQISIPKAAANSLVILILVVAASALFATGASALGTASISGHVTEYGTGTGIEGVSVQAYPQGGPYGYPIAWITSQAGGNYTIPGLDDGARYVLQFQDPSGSHMVQYYQNAKQVTSAAAVVATDPGPPNVDVQMRPGATAISGKVYDATTGLPVLNSQVTALDASFGGSQLAWGPTVGLATTDSQGRYTVKGLDPSVSYKVAYQAAHYYFVFHEDTWSWTEASPVPGNRSGLNANLYPYGWYLAEGTTAWGFSDYITIQNPNSSATTAKITYMPAGSAVQTATLNLPAASQTTVNPAEALGEKDFSTLVQSLDDNKPITVDRTMSWTGQDAPSPEGHCSVGVIQPERTWYLPEGSSAWGFECWLLIQNPGNADANCEVTYMIEGSEPKMVKHTVPKHSRASFSMEQDIGNHDASIKVTADQSIIAERSMYKNNRREGHESTGIGAPNTDFYLPEGTTAWGFTTYVLVQNPQDTTTEVSITFMTPTGPKVQPKFTMPANSRRTIRVNDIPEVASTDLSTQVHGHQPIIAERAMYWGAGTPLGEACHDSIGLVYPARWFCLPDGQTSDGRETWTLIQNTNNTEVTVEITYMTVTGKGNVTFEAKIPANSRRTFNMADKIASARAAVQVICKTSGKYVLVERAMYWNNRGAGTDTIGAGYY
ncbi:MAG: DUF5719 family protein [Candidatus Geothermincolia bacterium]